MIVYVESNFVLELALGRADAHSVRQLIEFSEGGTIELAIPTFSVVEPFLTLRKIDRDREQLLSRLSETLRESSRSELHREGVQAVSGLVSQLGGMEKREREALGATIRQVLAASRQLPISQGTISLSQQLQQDLGLDPPDSMVFASVLEDLGSSSGERRSVYVSQNFKDFGDPEVSRRLEELGCSYESTFANVVTRIQGESMPPGGPPASTRPA